MFIYCRWVARNGDRERGGGGRHGLAMAELLGMRADCEHLLPRLQQMRSQIEQALVPAELLGRRAGLRKEGGTF